MQNAYNPKPISAITTNFWRDATLQMTTTKTKSQKKKAPLAHMHAIHTKQWSGYVIYIWAMWMSPSRTSWGYRKTIATLLDDSTVVAYAVWKNEKLPPRKNRNKLREMMDNTIPNYLLNTIKCIYRNMKMRIKIGDGISEPIHINKAVRQGCSLSPVLLIYIY